MPAANIMENLQLPALQVPGESQGAPEVSPVWSSSSTPTLRRRRFKMRRMKNVQEQSLEGGLAPDLSSSLSPGKEFLQLPSIEITPSSDEDTPWSNCSTPSASPRRKRFLLRKWLRVRERKQCSESRYVPPVTRSFSFLPLPLWEELTGVLEHHNGNILLTIRFMLSQVNGQSEFRGPLSPTLPPHSAQVSHFLLEGQGKTSPPPPHSADYLYKMACCPPPLIYMI
ncbi:uncharacterized protein ACOB8E_020493 [Sarcophilus harrisii]